MLKIEDYLFKDNSIEAKRERVKSTIATVDGKLTHVSLEKPKTSIRNVTINASLLERSIESFIDQEKNNLGELFRRSISQCLHEIEGETLIIKSPDEVLKKIIEDGSEEKELRLLENYFGCFYSQVVVEEIKWPARWRFEDIFDQIVGDEEYKALYEQKPIEPAKGKELDVLGEMTGVTKKSNETETEYRECILSKMSDIKPPKFPKENGYIDESSSVTEEDWAFLGAKFEGEIQGFEGLKDGDTFNLHRPRTGQTFIENKLHKLKEDDRDHGDENKRLNVYKGNSSDGECLFNISERGTLLIEDDEGDEVVLDFDQTVQLKKFLNENIHDDVYVDLDKNKEGKDKNIVRFFANVEGKLKVCSLDRFGASTLHEALFNYLKSVDDEL